MRAVYGPTTRKGLSRALDKYLRRSDPEAKLLLQAARVHESDIRDTAAEWADSDSFTGYVTLADGGAKLTGGAATVAEGGTTDGDQVITDLDNASPREVVEIEWSHATASDREIETLTCRLHPDPGAAGRSVTEWRCRLFRLARIHENEDHELEPISEFVRVPAAGVAAADVVFDFRGATTGSPVTVGGPPVIDSDAGFSTLPRTYLFVWAVEGEGEASSNVAWMGAAGEDDRVSAGDYTSRHVRLTLAEDAKASQAGSLYLKSARTGMPEFALTDLAFSGATISFTGAKKFDLGAAPVASHQVVAQGQAPSGSAMVFELAVPGSGTWVQVFDGDIIGEDNTSVGGADLSSFAARQDYDARVALSVGAGGFSSPVARRFGIEDVELVDLWEKAATLEGYERAFDPTDLHSETGRATVAIPKLGVTDYRDFFTRLFSEYWPNQIEFRSFVGSPSIPRQDWLFHEVFLVSTPRSLPAHGEVRCVDVLAQLRDRRIPVAVGGERTAETFTSQPLPTVRSSLLTSIGVPGRRLGPNIDDVQIDTDDDGVKDASAVVSRTLKDEDGKRSLAAIDFLARGTTIASQGRYKFVRVHRDVAEGAAPHPVVAFPMSRVAVFDIDPGYDRRVAEFSVPFGWDERADSGKGKYGGEHYASHTLSLSKLGRTQVKPGEIPKLDEDIAQWIPEDSPGYSGLAKLVAEDQVEALGAGLIVFTFTSLYAFPELELGDIVAVQTDRFVGRHIDDDTALKGLLWLIGPIVRIADPLGTVFQVWVRNHNDVLPGSISVERIKYGDPQIVEAQGTVDSDGVADLDVHGNPDALSVVYATSTSSQPSRAATEAGTVEALDADKHKAIDAVATLAIGETLYVSMLAAEKADGTGLLATDLTQFRVLREPEQVAPTFEIVKDQSGGVGTVTIVLNDPSDRVTATSFEDNSTPDYDPGDPATWSGFDDSVPFGLTHMVTLVEKRTTTIHVGVRYDDQDGAAAWDIKSAEFDPDHIARVTSLVGSVDEDGKVTCAYTTDEDGDELFFTVGIGSAPSGPTASVNDGSTATVPDGTVTFDGTGAFADKEPLAGQMVFIKAAAENDNGELGAVYSTQFRVPGSGVTEVGPMGSPSMEVANEGSGNALTVRFGYTVGASIDDAAHDAVFRCREETETAWRAALSGSSTTPETQPITKEDGTGGTAADKFYYGELDLVRQSDGEVLQSVKFYEESGPP